MSNKPARRPPFAVVAEALALGLEVQLQVTLEDRPVRLTSLGQLQVRSSAGRTGGYASAKGAYSGQWWALERTVEWLVREARNLDHEDLMALEAQIARKKGAGHG